MTVDGEQQDIPKPIEELLYSMLNSNYAGWENNEGGQGSWEFNSGDKTIFFDFNYNTEEDEHHVSEQTRRHGEVEDEVEDGNAQQNPEGSPEFFGAVAFGMRYVRNRIVLTGCMMKVSHIALCCQVR
jgi:hypothetical protein